MHSHLLLNYPLLIRHDIPQIPIHLFQWSPRRQHPRLRCLITPLVIVALMMMNELILKLLALIDQVFEVLLLQLL
jgi:hypothetical protein